MLNLKGKVVRLADYRGEPQNRVLVVLNVRDIQEQPVQVKSRIRNPHIQRGRYLFVTQDAYNPNLIRSYYSGFGDIVPAGLFTRAHVASYKLYKWAGRKLRKFFKRS